jgi:hypothetical protein
MKKNSYRFGRPSFATFYENRVRIWKFLYIIFSEFCDARRGQLCLKSRHNKVCTEYRGGNFSSFIQMHLTYPEFLRPKPWVRVDPLYSVSFSSMYISTQITDFYWSEESFTSLFGFHWRYTEKGLRDELMSYRPHLFNISTIQAVWTELQVNHRSSWACGAVFLKKFDHILF